MIVIESTKCAKPKQNKQLKLLNGARNLISKALFSQQLQVSILLFSLLRVQPFPIELRLQDSRRATSLTLERFVRYPAWLLSKHLEGRKRKQIMNTSEPTQFDTDIDTKRN